MIKQQFSLKSCDLCDNYPTFLLFQVKDGLFSMKVMKMLVCDEHRKELNNTKDLTSRWKKWI